MESRLRIAHESLTSTAQRTFSYGDGELQGLAWDSRPFGLCVHVASYVPHQPTSLVPFPSRAKIKDTSTEPPPADHNYLEGDLFFVLSKNDLVICPSGARESVAVSYIDHILRKVGLEKLTTQYSIEPVANVDKVKLLKSEGVKKISLNASLYEATMEYTERQTTKMTLLHGLASEFVALFAEDKRIDLQNVGERENLSVKIEISFDSRKRGGEVGQQRLESAATKMIQEDDGDGFSIITGGDKKLTSDEIRINQKIVLPAHGNSVSRQEAWSSLAGYLNDLKESGTLQQ